jgi:hypothetical protein
MTKDICPCGTFFCFVVVASVVMTNESFNESRACRNTPIYDIDKIVLNSKYLLILSNLYFPPYGTTLTLVALQRNLIFEANEKYQSFWLATQ